MKTVIIKKAALTIARHHVLRRTLCHTSAIAFGIDFSHAVLGKAMICAELLERCDHTLVSYAAFAASLMVYIDSHNEKLREKETKEVKSNE